MIKLLTTTIRLGTLIAYRGGTARRPPSVPTEGPFLRPFTVATVNDNPGARKHAVQVGRGPGSGLGKFAGRGMKGHKSRTGGGVSVRFEGGQTPIHRRLPKYGQTASRKVEKFSTLNIGQIDYFVKKGILNPNEFITIKHLHDCGLAKKIKYGLKVLGKGLDRLNYPIKLEVSDASREVIQKIEQNQGEVRLVYRTPLKLREHIFPHKYRIPLAEPIPPAWRVKKLDRAIKNKGHPILYRKPAWKIEMQKMEQASEAQKPSFVYPVPRVPDPTKIHKRRVKLFRRVTYAI